MSVERSALRLPEDRARPRVEGRRLTLFVAKGYAKKYLDAVPILMRKAMAPGGVTGVFMALAFIVATDAVLLMTRYIESFRQFH